MAILGRGTALAYKGASPKEYFAADVAAELVTEYSVLVSALTDSRTTANGMELAYGRVFGIRGALCRICAPERIWTLRTPIVREWRWAEKRLRDFVSDGRSEEKLQEAATSVEKRWDRCAHNFIMVAASGSIDREAATHIGFLKAVDALALHLRQRDVFMKSHWLPLAMVNPEGLKLRIRVSAILIGLNRDCFEASYSAIRSYRETFKIDDPALYPWWFVDERLTERQSYWTYRRLPADLFDWRFE